MADDPILTAQEAAAYMRMPLQTLYYLNHRAEGPARMRVGKRVLYRQSALDAWLESCVIEPTDQLA